MKKKIGKREEWEVPMQIIKMPVHSHGSHVTIFRQHNTQWKSCFAIIADVLIAEKDEGNVFPTCSNSSKAPLLGC